MSTIDLRHASDDEIAAFVFDHPVGETINAWWWAMGPTEVLMEPRWIVEFLTRLFMEPQPLLARFSPAQIGDGFSLMFSAALPEKFAHTLWDDAVPWDERHACIRALPELYAGLFEVMEAREDDRGSAMYMLPDFLAFPYDLGERSRDSEGDRQVQDALLDAFARMLRSRSQATWVATLHGLGHLHHPDGPAVIHAFLGARPHLEEGLRSYAVRAMKGDIL